MAKLTSYNLALEIRFKEFDECGWIQYEILFLYKDQSMIHDPLLKRVNDHWKKRSPGAFKANELEYDRVIEKIQEALNTDKPVRYQPTDPDFLLAIYPQQIFPFIPHDWVEIYDFSEGLDGSLESEVQWLEDRDLLREMAGGRLADDPFTVILMVDGYNFGDERGYYEQGPAMILMTTRYDLQCFINELRAEYAYFCAMWEIPTHQSYNR